jgi:hypothetical protein
MAYQLGSTSSNRKNLSPKTEGYAIMEKLNNVKHWTSRSTEDFTYRIASDFLAQVENHIEQHGPSKTELAQRLQRTVGRISQMFNPGNITVGSAVRLCNATGMKVALVAYEDGDPGNKKGPINSEIFHRCWKYMGSPANFFELEHAISPVKHLVYYEEAVTGTAIDVSKLNLTHTATTRPIPVH